MDSPVLRAPKQRIMRTAVEILLAVAGLTPAVVAVSAYFGYPLDGAAIVAVIGVAVLVVTKVATVMDRAGNAPVVRTVAQVAVAIATVVPVAVVGLDKAGISIDTVALTAITGLAVMVTATIQNVLEGHGITPTLAGQPTTSTRRR